MLSKNMVTDLALLVQEIRPETDSFDSTLAGET